MLLTMNTGTFLDLLKAYQGKCLLFEYAPNLLVGANYHITEVKNIHVDSVDCGAGRDEWNETIIQLWESPSDLGKTVFMSAYKAMGILSKVNRMRPMDKEAVVKFEYGNATFHTTHLDVLGFDLKHDNLIIKLGTYNTDCKAKDTCGVSETVSQNTACEPGSGCC